MPWATSREATADQIKALRGRPRDRGLGRPEGNRGHLRVPARGNRRGAPGGRGFTRTRDRRAGPVRRAARAEPLRDDRPAPAADRRGLLSRTGGKRRRDGPEDRRDPRPRLVAFLRPELVHPPRDGARVGRPHVRSAPPPAESSHPERLSSRVDLQGLPGLRRSRGGPGGPGFQGLLPRLCDLLRAHVPLPQEGRARLGQPPQRDQGLLRRLLLRARTAPRRRPDRGDRAGFRLRRADGRRPPVREERARSFGRVGSDEAARPLVSGRDDLGGDRTGSRPRDADPGSRGRSRASWKTAGCRRRTSSSRRRIPAPANDSGTRSRRVRA